MARAVARELDEKGVEIAICGVDGRLRSTRSQRTEDHLQMRRGEVQPVGARDSCASIACREITQIGHLNQAHNDQAVKFVLQVRIVGSSVGFVDLAIEWNEIPYGAEYVGKVGEGVKPWRWKGRNADLFHSIKQQQHSGALLEPGQMPVAQLRCGGRSAHWADPDTASMSKVL